MLVSSVYLLFFIGTDAVAINNSIVCQNLLWLVSSVGFTYFFNLMLLASRFSTALEVTVLEVTALEVTVLEVTALEVTTLASRFSTALEVTYRLTFITQLRHVERSRDTSCRAQSRHETHIVNQAPPFYLGRICDALNFCTQITIAIYQNLH